MDERDLKELIAAVKRGQLPRRRFMQMVAAFGLTAPLATQLPAQRSDGLTRPVASRSRCLPPGRKSRSLRAAWRSSTLR